MPMRRGIVLITFLVALITATAGRTLTQPQQRVPVVLISIDGLKPDYVLEADKHGLRIPNLRRIVREGSYATGVTGVLPTVTYPSHTTMVTGVSPARHGIIANSPFDPFNKNLGGWYWYSEDIRVETLWDAAAKAGLTTGSLDWPVTVGAHITYNIAQYWRADNAEDRKLIRALSTPGLLAEAERAIGDYADGNDYSIEGDTRRAGFAVFLIQRKRPAFQLCYFGSLDEEEHKTGPYSVQTFATLEKLDGIIGQIRAAAEGIGGGRAIVCVVSDHGFMRTDKEVNINSALHDEGLIELDAKGAVRSWRAYAWYGGGSAGIMLRDRSDADAHKIAAAVLTRLASDEASGVAGVYEGDAARQLGGFPDAALVVTIRPGYRLGGKLQGAVTAAVKAAGTHGYAPDVAEMNSSFFIGGPGIASNRSLGQIDMRDIAPTLADFLGIRLPAAEGKDLRTRMK
jgi:predicted AlkP superfamily pyrophosphatase or phosphodiesterase